MKARGRRALRRAEERIKAKLARDGKIPMRVPGHIAKLQTVIDLEELHRAGMTKIRNEEPS
jgi:hypothetical protein